MPTIADLNVLLTLDARQLERGLSRAQGQLQGFGRSLQGVGRSLREAGGDITAGLSLPVAAIGGLAVKAAVDFESSFAGIRKTMDLTERQFGQLAQANRDLAKTIPVTVDELNRIGELGGQLGIRGIRNVVQFERTIAQLAVTTDLTAEEAATAFARIANVIQLPQGDIDRLGAAVVDLGNNFAATESEITNFAQRIAGAGQVVGLTAGDIAGIGAAFSAVGVQAERGGTAVQKVLLKMSSAAQQGGPQLQKFAQTAGLTAEAFAELIGADPGAAFTRFVEGLGRQGKAAEQTLRDLELADQRLIASFLSLAGAGTLLSRAMQTGNRAFQANSALVAEAAKRFGTTESQMALFRNSLRDIGITLGQALIPALTKMIEITRPVVELVARMAEAFQNASPTVQVVVTALLGLAAAAGPAAIVIGGMAAAIGAIVAFAAPIALVVAALAVVAASVKLGMALWQRWGDEIKKAVGFVSEALGAWDQFVGEVFAAVAETVSGAVQAFKSGFAGITEAAGTMVSAVATFLGEGFRAAIDTAKAIVGTLADAFFAARDSVIGAVKGIASAIKNLIPNAVRGLASIAEKALGGVVNAFQAAKDRIVGHSIVPDMIDEIGAEFGRLDKVMVAPAEGASGAVQRAFGGIRTPAFDLPALQGAGRGGAARAQVEPPAEIRGIWNRLGAEVEKAGGALQVFGGGLLQVLDDTVNGFGGFLDNLKGQLRTTFSQIGSSIGGAVGGGIGGIVGGLLGGVVDWVGGLFGGDDDDEPQKKVRTWVTVLEEATGAVRQEAAEIQRTTKAIQYLKKNLDRVSASTREVWKEAIGRLEEDLAGLEGTVESLNKELRNVPEGFKVALATFNATVPALGGPNLAAAGGAPTASLTGVRTERGFNIEQVNITTSGEESGEDVLRKIERAAQAREARGGGGVQLSRPVVR